MVHSDKTGIANMTGPVGTKGNAAIYTLVNSKEVDQDPLNSSDPIPN